MIESVNTQPSARLKEVPAEIGHLYGLRLLLLGNNEIPSLPVEISHLEALDTLHLFFNHLEQVPDELNQVCIPHSPTTAPQFAEIIFIISLRNIALQPEDLVLGI